MAEYYPLISRAVAGLRDGAPDARQAIYNRAKQALTVQLRGMHPPVPEQDIDREIDALNAAIDRIEAEIRPPPPAVLSPASTVPLSPPPAPSTAAIPLAPAPAEVATPKPQPSRPAAPLAGGAQAPAAPRTERLLFTPRSSLPSRMPAPRERSPVPRPSIGTPATTPEPIRLDPPPPEPVRPSSPPPVEAGTPKPLLPAAPTLDVTAQSAEPDVGAVVVPVPEARPEPPADKTNHVSNPAPEIAPVEPRFRDDAIRPAIPQSVVTRPRNLRVWIVVLVALAAVGAIALTAWKLRDRPEELARAPATTEQAPAAPNKINERADTGPSQDMDSDAADTQPVGAGAVQNPAPVPVAPAINAADATVSAQPAGGQAIPVSYKAAVLVDAPDTPEKVKTYIGSVVWRTESVSQGQDQPLGTAVRADVDIPDAKIGLVMEVRKNIEAQFPASHTIDLKFTVTAGSPIGEVKQISVPQMRREDMPTGDTLTGVPVSITDNYFLVGLTRGDAEARNMEALRTRPWFDIPMVLGNGRPAKITFEKGASGERIISDAMQTWSKP